MSIGTLEQKICKQFQKGIIRIFNKELDASLSFCVQIFKHSVRNFCKWLFSANFVKIILIFYLFGRILFWHIFDHPNFVETVKELEWRIVPVEIVAFSDYSRFFHRQICESLCLGDPLGFTWATSKAPVTQNWCTVNTKLTGDFKQIL